MKIVLNTIITHVVQSKEYIYSMQRAIMLLFVVALLIPHVQLSAQTIRPLTRAWYRLPYADATVINNPGNDLFQDAHNGYDIIGTPFIAWDNPAPHKIVAMASGMVIEVVDNFDECGLFADSTGRGIFCNNYIWIDHLNGEFSGYWHIAFESSQVDSGDVVSAGDWIAYEGDVGSTGSTDATYNRPQKGCDGTEDHTADEIPNCGMHLHFAVATEPQYEMSPSIDLHPRICGVAPHVIIKGASPSTCVPCNNDDACVSDTTVAESWTGELEVIVVDNALLTNGSVVVDNSVIGFQAGSTITLKPGFRAVTGSYFRAEIGPCESQ